MAWETKDKYFFQDIIILISKTLYEISLLKQYLVVLVPSDMEVEDLRQVINLINRNADRPILSRPELPIVCSSAEFRLSSPVLLRDECKTFYFRYE